MEKEKIYDTIIVGGGPAGLNTALYLARQNKRVAIFERGLFGGTLNDTSTVENLLGVETISGAELAYRMIEQVNKYDNVDFFNRNVEHITETVDNTYEVTIKDMSYFAKTVVIATGVSHKKLQIYGEGKTFNPSYCVTCDKMFYHGKKAVVIGGGDSALEGASELADIAEEVKLLYYKPKESMKAEKILQDRFFNKDNTEFVQGNIKEIIGDTKTKQPKQIVYESNNSLVTEDVDGVFVYVGMEPNTELLKNNHVVFEAIDKSGSIIIDDNMGISNNKGLFSAGDVVSDNEKQIAVALGDGAKVSRSIYNLLEG